MEGHSIFIPKRILESLALEIFSCGKSQNISTLNLPGNKVANPEKFNAPQDQDCCPVLHALTGITSNFCLKVFIFFTELKTNLNLEYPGFLGLGLNSFVLRILFLGKSS